uniref:Uncharacterized protein n=1 Tax=Anguilla anguilla TaxID=7936 RepID=A0A0E9Q2D1_ANGAN
MSLEMSLAAFVKLTSFSCTSNPLALHWIIPMVQQCPHEA